MAKELNQHSQQNHLNQFSIIKGEDRIAQKRGIKGCIFGKSGIGKTSLLWTLDPSSTLFVDLEAGDLAVNGWKGDTIIPKSWQEIRDLAAILGGINSNNSSTHPYSQTHYEEVCNRFGNACLFDKYETIFIDSITTASRLCFGWCRNQPQTFSEKSGKQDLRAAYGLQGQEMINWLIHLQHTRNKNIWFVGILDEKYDEFNRKFYTPQIEGSKTGLELPGIVDQVITMAEISDDAAKPPYRAFITHTINPYGYPAKDRSGKLAMIEEPHLGKLMNKIKEPKPITNNNQNQTMEKK